MSTIPPQIKIDIAAVNKAWGEMVRRVGEYFSNIREAMSNWLPAVSAAHEYEIKRMHKMYRRKQKARTRLNRRK